MLDQRAVLDPFDASRSPAHESALRREAQRALPRMRAELDAFQRGPHAETARAQRALELRDVAALLDRYNAYVEGTSGLFVRYDEALLDAERVVAQLEREARRKAAAEAL